MFLNDFIQPKVIKNKCVCGNIQQETAVM